LERSFPACGSLDGESLIFQQGFPHSEAVGVAVYEQNARLVGVSYRRWFLHVKGLKERNCFRLMFARPVMIQNQ